MNNFEYYNPVKVVFGKGEISKLGGLIPGGSHVMLTYGGGSIKKNGVYDQVRRALGDDFNVTEFGGIEANPRYETLVRCVDIVIRDGVDFLLAVGGGSVLDGTKFVAAASVWDGDEPWDILSRRSEIEVSRALPIGAVLTLPATGSEMNGNAVITREKTQEKLAFSSPAVMPRFSVLDPEVVFSLPEAQIANGIVDAFVHVLEQYLTYPVCSPIQDRFAEGILATLVEEGPKVIARRDDYDSAANFMWSATMALNGLIGVGVPQDWSTHMVGHELTAFHGIDHARTLAIVLPGMMSVKRENKRDKILQFGERIWGIDKGSDDKRIDAVIDKVVSFFESLGVSTKLKDYGVGSETIDKIVERFSKRGWVAAGERGDLTPDEISEALKLRL